MKRFWLLIIYCTFCTLLLAQSNLPKLADQFMRNGEYKKASSLYLKLYEKNTKSDYYLNKYVNALVKSDETSAAESALKKHIKKNSKSTRSLVRLGDMYNEQEKFDLAEKYYDKAISVVEPKKNNIFTLANTFNMTRNYKYSLKTYEAGRKMIKDPYVFMYEIANTYQRMGEYERMIEAYLDVVVVLPNRIQNVRTNFQRSLKEDSQVKMLQTALYKRIQKDNKQIIYPELLMWSLMQKKQYNAAFIQAKALDKRMNEDGRRIYNLGLSARKEKQYTVALKAFEYLGKKNESSTFYLLGKQQYLSTKNQELTEKYTYTPEELTELNDSYTIFLNEFGRIEKNATIIREQAVLNAFYLNDLPMATKLLNIVIKFSGISKQLRSQCKLDQGDFLLMQGERWDASLFYSQVDKDHKEDELGELARFKNAKLSYFFGDFEWSQSQLDVLKISTSELVANDAIDLSVFITDNLGMDTSTTAMEFYATSELLTFQNKFSTSLKNLNELESKFPGHSLSDDILFHKAVIYNKTQQYELVEKTLLSLVQAYGQDILADNAIFMLAELYENQYNNTDKASKMYESIILDYSNSILAVEARKRYRKLRGDELN